MTGIGIAVAVVAILSAMVLDHGSPVQLVNIPAMILVLGGTLGVTAAGGSRSQAKKIPRLLLRALKPPALPDSRAAVVALVGLAKEARRGGLVEMDRLARESGDPFLVKGAELVASSSDPEQVDEILGAEIEGMRARHRRGAKVFSDMGGFAPTLGILGTVIGLVHVLGHLGSPRTLGPAIATAFVATLWGVFTANVVWLPVANRLRSLSEAETEYRSLIIEGLLAIQAGHSTNAVRDRLVTYLPPADRELDDPATPSRSEEAAA